MPGIELERDETTAVTPDEAPTLEHRLRLANTNADIDPNIISDSAENDRIGNTYHNYIYNVQNNQRNTANVQNNRLRLRRMRFQSFNIEMIAQMTRTMTITRAVRRK
jgi:hypothetical protein